MNGHHSRRHPFLLNYLANLKLRELVGFNGRVSRAGPVRLCLEVRPILARADDAGGRAGPNRSTVTALVSRAGRSSNVRVRPNRVLSKNARVYA